MNARAARVKCSPGRAGLRSLRKADKKKAPGGVAVGLWESALLRKEGAGRKRISGPGEDEAPVLDLDPQGIAFLEAGAHEPPTAESDHRDAHSRVEI